MANANIFERCLFNQCFQFYHFSVCHLCKSEKTADLKKCSSCRIVFYCSREHQKQDWGEHKELCKIVRSFTLQRADIFRRSAEGMNHLKTLWRRHWQAQLKRELLGFEDDMWMFPKMCAVCYSEQANIICECCKSVAYCSRVHRDEHKGSHQVFCLGFKLNLIMQLKLGRALVGVGLVNEMKVDWSDFHGDLPKLPANLEECVKFFGFCYETIYSDHHLMFIQVADFYSLIATLIYGLEVSRKVVNHVACQKNLVIHIVGAAQSESILHWITNFEFLTHWMPNVTSIEIYCIGPEASKSLDFNFPDDMCSRCKRRILPMKVLIIKDLYHNVSHQLPKPMMVCAFSCDLRIFKDDPKRDTWKWTLPKLINNPNTPLLLTGQTFNEINEDVNRFKKKKIEYILTPQINPYASMKPFRNPTEGDEPIYYRNGYITIIQKK